MCYQRTRRTSYNNKRVNPLGIYNNYKHTLPLKTEPQIDEGKTDRMEGRNRNFNSNSRKHPYPALNNG